MSFPPGTGLATITNVLRRNTHDDVLHVGYLPGLLPQSRAKEVDQPYYRGDVYDDVPTYLATQWQNEMRGDYYNKLKRSCRAFPSAKYLKEWMEVSTALSRYTYLAENLSDRAARAQRITVTQIDFRDGEAPGTHEIADSGALQQALDDPGTGDPAKRIKPTAARLFVVEDLSRDMIELFGSKFDIDPHFFRSQVNDYMWNTVASNKTELRDLDVVSRQRSHFMLQYLRPRYYKNEEMFVQATIETGRFNVLRQLDSDRSRKYLMDKGTGAAVCLMRAKLSLWFRPASKNHKFPIGILLVDPTPSEGKPLWGGYTSFANWETDPPSQSFVPPPRRSLYADLLHWIRQTHDSDIAEILNDPTAFAIPALKLLLSDWHYVVQYMTTQVAQVEWQIELPEMRQNEEHLDDAIISKLYPWRRNMSIYRAMVVSAIHRLYPDEPMGHRPSQAHGTNPQSGLQSLRADFQIILDSIDSIQAHITQLEAVASAMQSLDETRQAQEQNRQAQEQNNSLSRLTYLATLFIPLSFVSGLLSMVPDVTALTQTFWIFFIIAIPLTAIALVAADFLGLRTKLMGLFKSKKP